MIFVNDFWSLLNMPRWLGHAEAGEDLLGFSDIVFPAFLFAIGLSIPFAIENRLAKGETPLKTVAHILLRTFALLVMGVFAVNADAGLSKEVGMRQPVFKILMVAGFFLIWNVYPKVKSGWKKYLFVALQLIGVALLIYLAVIFRDRSGDIIQKRWWGILGLIGWTYLLCASVYLFARKRLQVHFAFLIAFVLLNMAGSNGWLGVFDNYIISNGAFHGFTMSGLIVSLLFSRYASSVKQKNLFAGLIGAGTGLILVGVAMRHWWIINKLSATPSWVFACTGISVLLYVFLYLLVEEKGKERWFGVIKPAGTATLTFTIFSFRNTLSLCFPGSSIFLYTPFLNKKPRSFSLMMIFIILSPFYVI
jgi:predicted acyltransferase